MKPAVEYYQEIFQAIRRDDLDLVRSILQSYPESAHWREKKLDRTGLMVAVAENNPSMVRLFMEHGADQFAQQWAGGSALRIAVDKGEEYLDVVEILLEYPQDLNNLEAHGGILPLWKAMQNDENESIVDMLADAGANPSLPGRKGDDEPIYQSVEREESPEMNVCIRKAKVRWDAAHLAQTTTPVSRQARKPSL
jgi:ankyrin repeat protein